ncbi:S-layer homology domain-containing protein [Slackia piriformis]|nr:S-layer homology domain-containing protein [Slackia piriformis]
MAADDPAIFGNANVQYSAEKDAQGNYKLTYTGAPVDMYVKAITAKDTVDAYALNADYQVRYFEDTNNNKVLDAGDARLCTTNGGADDYGKVPPVAVGHYFVVAIDNTAWADFAAELGASGDAIAAGDKFLADVNSSYGVIEQYFEVVPQDFSGIAAYEINQLNDEDTSDRTFTYNGDRLVANIALGNEDLQYGTDYTVSCNGAALNGVDVDSDGEADGFALPTDKDGITNAGEYDLVVTPHGAYTNYGQAKLTVTVEKLDLSKADIFVADYKVGNIPSPWYSGIEVNGVAFSDMMHDLKVVQYKYTTAKGDELGVRDNGYLDLGKEGAAAAIGGYRYTMSAIDADNVTGEQDFDINVVTDVVDQAFYGEDAFAAALDGKTFYGDEWAFDGSKVSLYNDGAPYTGAKSVVVKDANGNVVESVEAAGRYTVTVQAVPSAENYAFGGTFRAEFTYFRGQVDTASVEAVATIDGQNVPFGTVYGDDEPTSLGRVYDGTAVEPAITVKAGANALAAGSDYTVTYKNAQGEVVDSMVDAGTYVVTVSLSNEYVFADAGAQAHWFVVEIQKRSFDSLGYVANTTDPSQGDTPGVLYTGSEIDPVLVGSYRGTDGDTYTVTLDPSWYQITGITYKAEGAERYTDVDSIVEPGEYRLSVTPTSACKNYTWLGGDGSVYSIVDLTVIALGSFYDVPSNAWYADEVSKAFSLGYVNGMGNNLFFPDADMTRAQFAQVVYNMAGEPAFNENQSGTYPTQFSDVEADAWYAKAVSWASEAGIVNGTSDTTFDPEGKISREQIATMLYRYAGNGATADQAVLDAFVDGDEVSEWAANEMAWAVEHGYMNGRGNNDLQPQGTATRAEIAALAVRVQPEAL